MNARDHFKKLFGGIGMSIVLAATAPCQGPPVIDVGQPAKMTAILQSVADADRPVLLRVDPEAGHDQYGSTRAQMQLWRTDQLAFLMWQLGVSPSGSPS